MQKVLQFLKFIFSTLLKIIMAIMMGLASSLGKNPIDEEKKNIKTIEKQID